MLRNLMISFLVLFLQTGFYLQAGNHISLRFSEQSFSRVNSEINENISVEKDILFVVKHCKSPNVVVYQAKRTNEKDLDPQKPVDVYWLMNTKGKKIESLTLLEWKMAFGFKLQTILKGKQYMISLNAIKNKEILITQNEQGEVEGLMKINGILSKLKEVYINFEPSLIIPNVKYVDFSGTDLASGKLVKERFWNN